MSEQVVVLCHLLCIFRKFGTGIADVGQVTGSNKTKPGLAIASRQASQQSPGNMGQ